MPLCAACGEEAGRQYVRDTLHDLVYCTTHSHLSGQSDAKTCFRCGQRVASSFYTEDTCPRCGSSFQEAARARYEADRAPTLERLGRVGPVQFLPFALLSCIVAGSLLFVLLHFVGRLIAPVIVAAIFAILVLLPQLLEYYRSERFLGRGGFWDMIGTYAIPVGSILDLPGVLAMDRIEEAFVGDYVKGDELQSQLRNGFTMGSFPFRAATVLSKLSLLTVGSLVVELFWPGYVHTLLVAAAIAIPVSVLDAILFRRIVYREIERYMAKSDVA